MKEEKCLFGRGRGQRPSIRGKLKCLAVSFKVRKMNYKDTAVNTRSDFFLFYQVIVLINETITTVALLL